MKARLLQIMPPQAMAADFRRNAGGQKIWGMRRACDELKLAHESV